MARGFGAKETRGFGAKEYGGSYEGHPSRDTYIGVDEAGREIRGDDEGNRWVAGGGRITGRIFGSEEEAEAFAARKESAKEIEKFALFTQGKDGGEAVKYLKPEEAEKYQAAAAKYNELRKIATKVFNAAEEAAKEKWKSENPGKTDYAGRPRVRMVEDALKAVKAELEKQLGITADSRNRLTPVHTTDRNASWESFKRAITDDPNRAAAAILLEKMANDKTAFLRTKGHLSYKAVVFDMYGNIDVD